MELTSNAVTLMTQKRSDGLHPVVQVLDVKHVSTAQNSAGERFRMLISDGTHTQQSMLATQMNHIVKEGRIKHGSIVQLHEFLCNEIQNRKIIIVIGLDIIHTDYDQIGNPKPYEASGTPSSTISTGVSVTPKSTLPQNNPSPNTNQYLRSQNPKPHLPNPKPENPINQNFQYRPPGNNNFNNNRSIPLQQPLYQPPVPNYINRGPIMKNDAPVRFVPISSLNPYQGRWTIKARVTLKGELRSWSNARSEGKVFSFDLLDSEGGEIRATCFNSVAEQFHSKIESGKVYLLSKGTLKPARKEFNPLNNDYEINLDTSSTIEPCFEEDNSIPKITFNFRPISEIELLEANSMIDVIGIVTNVSPSIIITKKNGMETQKRTLTIKDMSGKCVEITIWGNLVNSEGAELQSMVDSGIFPILAIKTGRINDFNGKSVSTVLGSQLFINPNFIQEANELKDWYDREGKNTNSVSISREMTTASNRVENRKTVNQIKDEGLGKGEKPDWISVKGVITVIKGDNFCYTACPLTRQDRTCAKKVTNNGDGSWRCEMCNQNVPECDYRYILQFQIGDHTGTTWVTAFNEAGEEIMGISAKELYLIKFEEQDEDKYTEIIKNVMFNQYLIKLKVKEETYNDEARVKAAVMKADKVDPCAESNYLLGLIDKLISEDQTANVPQVNVNVNVTANPMPMVYCSGCGGNGHNVQNCPMSVINVSRPQGGGMSGGFANRSLNSSGIGGGGGMEGNSSVCYKCQQSGHWARDCPTGTGGSSAVGTGGGGGMDGSVCYKCQQSGHWARDCPSGTGGSDGFGTGGGGGMDGTVCYKCQKTGHWARDCPGTSRVAGQYGGPNQFVGGY